jgi:hypothetical protein
MIPDSLPPTKLIKKSKELRIGFAYLAWSFVGTIQDVWDERGP